MDSHRVLIVEDNLINAMTMEAILRGAGHRVVGKVTSADDILADFDECTPDLIIMDVMLKGSTDGIEAAQQLREQCNTPIVFISALSDKDTEARMMAVGNSTMLSKPYGEQKFLNAVRLVIE